MPLLKRRVAAVVLAALVAGLSAEAGTTRFALIADPHVGAGRAAADLETVIASINALSGIDFAVVLGDVTEKGRDAEFAEAKRALAGLRIPCLVLPGNHDAHWIGQGLAGFLAAWPGDRFVFEAGGRLFLGLNSWDFGHLAPNDLDWLDGRVADASSGTALFTFIHAPPAYVDNWFRAHNALRSRPAVVFSGHVHRTEILDASGIPVVTCRRSLGSAETPPGYVLIEAGDDTVSVFEVNAGEAPRPAGSIPLEGWTVPPELPAPILRPATVRILGRAELGVRVSVAPAGEDGRFVVAGQDGRILAFDAAAREIWAVETEGPPTAAPAIKGSDVFAASGSRILKLDARTGRERARFEAGERITSTPEVLRTPGGPILAAGTVSGRLIALTASALAPVWENVSAGDMIAGRPLAVRGSILFGSWDARLRAVDARSGTLRWSWTGSDSFYYAPAVAPPASDGRQVFICAPDGFVSAVDLEGGGTRWREKVSAWESLSLSSDGRSVFVKSRTDGFLVLDARTGGILRRAAPAHGEGDIMPVEPVEGKRGIYYGSLDGKVYRISRDGRAEAVLDFGPAGVHTLAPLGRGRFAGVSLDGSIIVFRE